MKKDIEYWEKLSERQKAEMYDPYEGIEHMPVEEPKRWVVTLSTGEEYIAYEGTEDMSWFIEDVRDGSIKAVRLLDGED